jgi:uncharacterized damage-inducible protein DinB
MTLDDVRTLLAYHYWARDRMLDAVSSVTSEQQRQDLGSSFPSIHATVVHVYSAEWIWHQRWTGQSPAAALPADRFPDLAAITAAWQTLEREMRALVEALAEAGLAAPREYKLLSGQPGVSTGWQMFQHVVNHATYHRGQVMTMLRQSGGAPQSTDLIAFHRLQAPMQS